MRFQPATVRLSPWRAFRWFGDGLRMWGRAPVSLTCLALLPVVVETLIQLTIPVIGIVMSKVAAALVGVGPWIAVDRLARGERIGATCVIEGLRAEHRAGAITSLVTTLIVFATQLTIAVAAYGSEALGVLSGRISPAGVNLGFVLVLILPGLVPITLLVLALPLALFDGVGPQVAISRSIRSVARRTAPFAVFLVVGASLMLISLACAMIPFLVVMPWLLATSYAAYRDVRGVEVTADTEMLG